MSKACGLRGGRRRTPLAIEQGGTEPMTLMRRALEATASGLLVALLAPPIAAAVFLLNAAVRAGTGPAPFDASPGSVLLLFIGVASGAYLLGAIPAFLAGLALPTLRQLLGPLPAATATGVLGAVAYAMTFGSHLMPGPNPVDALHHPAFPAFVGVSVAALLTLRVERRHAETLPRPPFG